MPQSLPQPGDALRAAGIHPTEPGHILFKIITARQITVPQAASLMHMPPEQLDAIVDGSEPIRPESAQAIAAFTSTSPRMWTNMQAAINPDVPQ